MNLKFCRGFCDSALYIHEFIAIAHSFFFYTRTCICTVKIDPVNLEMLPSAAEALSSSGMSKGIYTVQKTPECEDVCLTPGCVYTG